MEQWPLCLFLTLKGLSARAVHDQLTTVLGPDGIAGSAVTDYLRQRQFPFNRFNPTSKEVL
jgi:hypothetical protein